MKKLTKTDRWALAIIIFFACFIVTLILATNHQSQNSKHDPSWQLKTDTMYIDTLWIEQ